MLLARVQGQRLRAAPANLAKVGRTLEFLGLAALGGRDAGDLSGGRKQPVGAAQALAQEPQVPLLDEPTSALDLHRRLALLEVLRRLARERGLPVMVALHGLGPALRLAGRAWCSGAARWWPAARTGRLVTPALPLDVRGIEARVETCTKGRAHFAVVGTAQGLAHSQP